mmetsp:Transcript_55649/g.146062  ORF Transcript_55649/g.146062 Transcript_55649/m.146062 type:complete len:273 (-) Transcript_55649:31-849(-)
MTMRLRLAAHVDVCVRRRPTSNVEPERIETTMHMRKTNDPCCWRSRLACLVEQEGSRSHKLHFFCRRRRLSGPGARASRACLRPSASKDICLPPRGRDEDRKQPTGERGCKVLAVTKREGDEDRVDRDARPVEVYLEPAQSHVGGEDNAGRDARRGAAPVRAVRDRRLVRGRVRGRLKDGEADACDKAWQPQGHLRPVEREHGELAPSDAVDDAAHAHGVVVAHRAVAREADGRGGPRDGKQPVRALGELQQAAGAQEHHRVVEGVVVVDVR